MQKFILAFLFMAASSVTIAQTPDTRSQLQHLTDSLVNYFHTKMNVVQGGMFLKVVSPKGEYLVSSGITPEVHGNSHFRIASNSKTFTAASIMLLQQEGKLNIDDIITDKFPGTDTPYLPETSDYDIPYKTQITIRQLLQHRAGVFDVTNTAIPSEIKQPYAGKIYHQYIRALPGENLHTFTFDELIGVVSKNQLFYFLPGTDFHYSNTGYNILGKIIERASGMSLSDFLSDRFIKPLQLTNTIPVWMGTDITMPEPFIQSYYNIDGSDTNTTLANVSMHVSEGNLVSTPDDLARWIRLLISGHSGVNSESVSEMEKVFYVGGVIGTYGLGLVLDKGLGYGHDGGRLSYISFMRHNPENDITIIMLFNFIIDVDKEDYILADFGLRVVDVISN